MSHDLEKLKDALRPFAVFADTYFPDGFEGEVVDIYPDGLRYTIKTLDFSRALKTYRALVAGPPPASQVHVCTDGWMPIEKAPKDDKRLLVAFQDVNAPYEWHMFFANACGPQTNAPGYAAPTHFLPRHLIPHPPVGQKAADDGQTMVDF